MAQVATQRTTGVTRFKGPTVITMRGAGSAGHDAQTTGAGIDIGLSVQVPTTQSVAAFQVEKPDGTVVYSIDGTGATISSGVSKVQTLKAQIALTAAQIFALNSAPLQLIAAPGAGKVILLHNLVFQMTYGTVQFTGGGAVSPVYHGATTNLLTGSVAAATVTAAANATISAGAEAAALALTTNTAVDFRAATADFAAGDSTAIVTVWYSIITLG